MTHFKIQSEGEGSEEHRPCLVLKGCGSREKGTISSLHFSWILPVVDNVKVPGSTWCTCIIQIMHFSVVTLTTRKQGWVKCAMETVCGEIISMYTMIILGSKGATKID